MKTMLEAEAPANFVTFSAVGFTNEADNFSPVGIGAPLPVRQMGSASLMDRLRIEGDPLPSFPKDDSFTSFAKPASPGASVGIPITLPAAGRALYIDTVSIFATAPCYGRFQIGSTNVQGGGNVLQSDIAWFAAPGGEARVPVGQFLRYGQKPAIACWLRGWADPAPTGTQIVGMGATGFQLADSLDFGASKVILCIGDSTWNGTGPSSNATCIPWLINDYYRNKGVRSRYILKAYSGSTTIGHDNFRSAGRYDFEQVDAIFCNVGINDFAGGVSVANAIAALDRMNSWRKAIYPKARMIVFGPTPVQNASHEAAMAALRAAQLDYVTAKNDASLRFFDQGNAFTAAAYSNYAASDTNGSAIHPGDAGLAPLWVQMKAFLDADVPEI